jgi:putative FmdB family regulatory protein
MPIYEYRCGTCGYQNEYLQKVSDPRLTDCPECGKPTFNKLVSAAGFQLKGNGWYVTDFKNNGAKAKGSADKGESSEAKSEAKDTKKDDKPEPACGTGASPACS